MTTLHEAFGARTRADGAATALVHGGRRVDYATLDRASDTVAAALQAAGAGPGRSVPVLLSRSADLVAVLLGVVKTGAAYAALDPSWPAARTASLVARLGTPAVVPAGAEAPGDLGVLRLPAGGIEQWAQAGGKPRPVAVADGDPATVFLTSGTTGEPKAVVSPHRATTRLITGCDFVELGPATVMPVAAPVPWDAFSFELWAPLLTGGTAVVVEEPYLDAHALRTAIRRDGANTAWQSASLFNLVVDEDVDAFDGLHQLVIGGERLSPQHVRRFLERHPATRLVNGYGPVECTIFVTTHPVSVRDCDDPRGIPIGAPVADTEVLVLGPDGPVGVGETGEICIAGPRLAAGYLGDAAETGRRFPTVEVQGREGRGSREVRVYRTGDLGHRGEDGALRYEGRRDRQVKVRGHRIEPEGVEHVLAGITGVRGCAVVPEVDGSGTCTGLVALVTTDGSGAGASPDAAAVRREAERRLPRYLVPDRVEVVERLPLLPTGKLDRRRLVPPGPGDPAPGDAPHAAVVEEVIADVVGVRPAPDVSLFALGASSLDVGRICARLGRRLGQPVPLSEVLATPTAAAITRWVERAAGPSPSPPAVSPSLSPSPAPTDRVPLLPIQVGFLLANQLSSDVAANCPFGWWADGPLDAGALRAAVHDVAVRHEALRARYVLGDPPLAVVEGTTGTGPTAGSPVGELPPAADEAAAQAAVVARLMEPLDLGQGEVWRVVLAANRQTPRTLVGVSVHHIAWDGNAEVIVVRDLSTAYAARLGGRQPAWPSPAPALADVHAAYHHQRSRAQLDRQREYLRSLLAGIPELELGGAPDPSATTAGALDAWLTPEDTRACDALARAAGTTRFTALLNAYVEAIATVTGQTDFGVGIPVTKRHSAVLDEAVSCLIDVVCVRAAPWPDARPADALGATAHRLRGTLAAQDVPFDEVVRLVNPVRTERPPLYQTMFTLEPKDDPGLRLGPCALEFLRFDPPVAMTDLGCALWPQPDDGYRAHLIFRPDRVDPGTVAAIGDAIPAAIRRRSATASAAASATSATSPAAGRS